LKKNRDYKGFLIDILDAIEEINNFTQNVDFESFINNKEKAYASIYCLQVIGEAVKNIPSEIKEKNPQVPWREIAGMRDKLIHGYFTVDFEKVWETINRNLSDLKEVVAKILKSL